MKKKFFLLLFLIAFLKTANVVAQVTIGINELPDNESLLDLKEKQDGTSTKALHFPRMTTSDRDNLTQTEKVLTKGLVIYNTTTNCLEYWNLLKWVSLCAGQANINFELPNGSDAGDITQPAFPAAGGLHGPFIPNEEPKCTGQDPAYTFLVTSGAEYTSVHVENSVTGQFSISMSANETAISRTAIVRIINNCTNEYKEFIFSQDGDNAVCSTATPIPDIVSTGGTVLCNNGAVFLYLPGADVNGTYIWTLGGVEKGRGTKFTATIPGIYTVYSAKMGCTAQTPKTITVAPGANNAPSPVTILVGQNNGLVCDDLGTSKLFATAVTGTGETIIWYKNGIEEAGKTGSSIDAGIGEWFAVVKNSSGCLSIPSNSIQVIKDPASGTQTSIPEFTINGQPVGEQMAICSGGILMLQVKDLVAGETYKWYVNQTVKGIGEYCEIPLTGLESGFILQCQATGSGCSNATVAKITFDVYTAPGIPNITINTPGGAICDGAATLTANSDGTAVSYIWYESGSENGTYSVIPGETSKNLTISHTGYYKVVAVNAASCRSEFSSAKAVSVTTGSTSVTITGPQNATQGETKTYTAVMDNPQGASYSWTVEPGATGATPTSGSGSSIAVRFTNYGTAKIKLVAANACGDAVINNNDYTVTVSQGCVPAGIGSYSPANRSVSLFAGNTASINVTASGGANGSGSFSYQWFQNTTPSNTGGTSIAGTNSAAFDIPTNLTANNTYYYYCEVTGCSTPVASQVFTVEVKANPVNITSGSGSLAGRMNFDVAQTNNGDCGDLTLRKKGGITAWGSYADFADNKTRIQTYTFTPKGTVSNVRFEYIEAQAYQGQLIASISGGNPGNNISTPVDCIVTYKDLNTLATGKSNVNALKVDIYVIYNENSNGTGADRKLKLTASIKDCFSCGAYTKAGTWLNFMCYNLGADETLISPAQQQAASPSQTYGGYYPWGRSSTNPTPPTGNALNTAWGHGEGKNLDYDPCPTGFRVPSQAQIASLSTGNTNHHGYTSNDANQWVWKSNTNTTGAQVGAFLFFPAAGYGYGVGQNVRLQVSEATYWTSTPSSTNNAYDVFMYNGALQPDYSFTRDGILSIRCVAEKND